MIFASFTGNSLIGNDVTSYLYIIDAPTQQFTIEGSGISQTDFTNFANTFVLTITARQFT